MTTNLGAESAAALEQIAVGEHDPRSDALKAAAGGEVIVFDAEFIGPAQIAGHALWPLITWLGTDECNDELAAAVLKLRPGDLDHTTARAAVRDVLDALYEVLEREYPVPW